MRVIVRTAAVRIGRTACGASSLSHDGLAQVATAAPPKASQTQLEPNATGGRLML